MVQESHRLPKLKPGCDSYSTAVLKTGACGQETGYRYVNSRAQAHLRSMSKGRASRRAKSHQTMTQAKSRAVDRKSTMFQGDLK